MPTPATPPTGPAPEPARGASIAAKLRVMVWWMVLPTVLLSAIAGVAVFRAERRAVVNAATETARALSLVTDREMAVRAAQLQALSVSPSLREGRLDRFHEEASRVAGAVNTIVLTRADGQQLMNTRLRWGQDLPHSTAFPTGMPTDRRLLVSDLYLGPVDQAPSFSVRIPVLVAGEAAYLGFGSPVKELQQIFRQQPLPQGWLGVVLDREGYVAARTLEPEKRVGQRASENMRRAMVGRDRGVVDARTLDGVAVFTVFSRAPDSGWVVLIGLSQSEIAESAWAAFGLTLTVSVIFVLLALVVARRMGLSIVEPLRQLRLDALHLGGGGAVRAASPSGMVEIDTVQQALVAASGERASSDRRLREEIAAAVAQTRSAQEAALRSQKLEALGRLTGGIAHDFNNLLQTMTTGLQLATRLSQDPRAEAALAACRRATERAATLTRQLLAFGRQQVGHEAVIELRARLDDLMELIRGAVGSAVDVELAVDEALWPVRTDPVQLELALLNLALNARDAMKGRGRLRVAARNETLPAPAGQRPDASVDAALPPGDYVVIAVRDDGQGMSAEQMARAFEPFYTTKPVGQGTGLGLAQVYALARNAGGGAVINSKPGLGTEVTLFLPRSHGRPEGETAAAPAGGVIRHHGTVLLVEDEASVRELTAQALEERGLRVVTAPTADHALDLLRGGLAVDVVLSDIVMPGTRSGIDLVRTLRVLKPTLPVVLASGHAVRIEEVPDVPLIAKPYDVDQVVERLAQAMDQATSGNRPSSLSNVTG